MVESRLPCAKYLVVNAAVYYIYKKKVILFYCQISEGHDKVVVKKVSGNVYLSFVGIFYLAII